MTLRSGSSLYRIAFAVFATGALLALASNALRPSMPQPGLDASWIAVTGEASAHRVRWGIDIAFTYGPAAPVATTYYNADWFRLTLPLLAVIYGAFGLLAGCLLFAPPAPGGGGAGLPVRATVVGAGLLAFAAALAQIQSDWFFLAPSLMLLFLGLRRADRLDAACCLLASLALGVLPLTKTSYAVTALAMPVLLDMRQIARRRLPPFTVAFALAFLAAYVAYGQHLGDLGPFLATQLDVARGYAEAMGASDPTIDALLFSLAAAAWVGVSALRSAGLGDGSRLDRALLSVGIALYAWILLKAGYVREDGGHAPIALAGLAIGLVLHAAALYRRAPRIAIGLAASGIAVAFVAIPLEMLRENEAPMTPRAAARLLAGRIEGGFASHRDALASAWRNGADLPASLDRAKAGAWADLRARSGFPPLAGGVDMVPLEQSGLLAAGLDFRMRPSFQNYSTYTDRLAAANQAFLLSPRAPENVIFSPDTIDERYPATAEGALWPDLLRLYRPAALVGEAVDLRRRQEPLGPILGPAKTRTALLGHPLPVGASGPVFARIDLRRTWLGEVAAALFKPPALSMTVRRRDGREQTFRFIPSIARAGFVLSPMIEDAEQYAALAVGLAGDMRDRDVETVTVEAPSWARPFFHGAISVELRPMDLSAAAADPGVAGLRADLAGERPWLALLRQPGLADDVRGNRLSGDQDVTVDLATPHGTEVRLGFGLFRQTWIEGGTTRACFAASTGPGAVAWRGCLDAAARPADRGAQTARFAIPADAGKLTLSVSCGDSCLPGTAYWSRVEVAPTADNSEGDRGTGSGEATR